MKKIWNVLNECRAEIERHPFFEWLRSDEVPLGERFVFTPVLIDFIMSFADLNKWFLRYPEPQGAWESAINEHTNEDATHSLLFVQNWAHLNLGATPQWPASKALWWMFHSRESQVVRELGMDILRLSVEFPDPLVRFPMMEAVEICGDVFFAHTADIAQRLEDEQRVEHLYYGPYHRARETGHLQADEGSFNEVELSPLQRQGAEQSARIVFGNFSRLFDQLLDFSRRALSDPGALERSIDAEYAAAMTRPEPADTAPDTSAGPGTGEPRHHPRAGSREAHRDQVPLLALLDERKERLRQHRFLAWLEDGPASAERLQNFIPLWGIDVVSYKDFNQLVLRYAKPASAAEASINRWADDLASHGVLYLQDWAALGLDELLGWKMVDAVAYYFLSEHTELHRRNMSKVKKLAFGHDDPMVRWWLMTALEEGGEPLFAVTRKIALELEAAIGAPLNYWAGRHGLAEPRGQRPVDHAFLDEGMSRATSTVVRQLIGTVFDNLEEQLELSYRVVRSRVFSTAPASLPPSGLAMVAR